MRKFEELIESVLNEKETPKVGDAVRVKADPQGRQIRDDHKGKIDSIKGKKASIKYDNGSKDNWEVDLKYLDPVKDNKGNKIWNIDIDAIRMSTY